MFFFLHFPQELEGIRSSLLLTAWQLALFQSYLELISPYLFLKVTTYHMEEITTGKTDSASFK